VQLTLPILIPLLAAALSLLAWRHLWVERVLGVAGAAGQLCAGVALLNLVADQGIQVIQLGAWPAPFGITLVADHLSALMVLVTGIIGTVIACYSLVDIDRQRQSFAYFPLLNVMLMGVAAALLAGDLFNLYVWFEVLLISSFVLLALGSQREQLEGSLEYVTLNLVSSFVLLAAVGILYGVVGTLNMADASQKLATVENRYLVLTLAMLFLFSFGLKAALFPLYFWLPPSYHTPPSAVSAAFAGLLTKVGVYALLRSFTLLFAADLTITHTLILWLSGFTMLTGVLAALAHTDLRRILSSMLIGHIGFMTMGLGIFTVLGLAGSVFYLVHDMLVKCCLFLVAGIMHALRGSHMLDRLGGLYRQAPWLALLFAIAALSLAGLPPLSGFVGKLILVKAGLEAGHYAIVAIAMLTTLLTLYAMARVFAAAFWAPPATPQPASEQTGGEHPPRHLSRGELAGLAIPTAVLALLTILAGVFGEWLFGLCHAAAQELLDPQQYIQAVLGG
jgi:multicomponent Na+:H+ antiporter subunit D